MMRACAVGFFLGSLGLLAVAQRATPPAPDEQLVYEVVIERHGVRSPTGKSAQYDRYSSAPWPAWKVAPGNLTPHGHTLLKLLGTYDREHLHEQGLLTATGCSDVTRVTIHTDSDERTRETGKALAEGMFPGCVLPVVAREEGENDPLFHLPSGAVTAGQAELGAAAVLGRIGGTAENATAAFRPQLLKLDALLTTCGGQKNPKRESILETPAAVAPGTGDHVAEMRGPLNTASTLTENMLLEYTEGMPASDVGWGCVDGPQLRELIGLHTGASELALRTSAVAVPTASALLRATALSLRQARTGKTAAGAEGRPSDKLLLLVGHDTNLSTIAGALHLDWVLDGRMDDTPPGSALVFELWKDAEGKYGVRVYFTAQTLEQMRDAMPLSGLQEPPRVPVFVPGCSDARETCPAESLEGLLLQVARSK
jgi:4-phytase/acid phosphatase